MNEESDIRTVSEVVQSLIDFVSDDTPQFFSVSLKEPKDEPLFDEEDELPLVHFKKVKVEKTDKQECDGPSFILKKQPKKDIGKRKEKGGEKDPSQTTPQCFLCMTRPISLHNFLRHLEKTHKTSLRKKGYWIECACGSKITSYESVKVHNRQQQCNGRSFRLKKLTEGGEEDMREVKKEDKKEQMCITLTEVMEEFMNREREGMEQADGRSFSLTKEKENDDVNMDQGDRGEEEVDACDGRSFIEKNEKKDEYMEIEEEKEKAADGNSKPTTTPQCFLCEARPLTIGRYMEHLKKQHNTTLLEHGYSLQCECGRVISSERDSARHDVATLCPGLSFALGF